MVTLELGKLSNAAVHSKLLDLAAGSRCNEAFMLRFLSEVEDRKLHLDKGYPSLFEYCRVELKVSESSAWRLIASARAAQQHPQIYELLAAGTIHSTAVAMIASSLKDDHTAPARLALACGKTKRELEVMIAGWSAKPAAKVKDSIKALAPEAGAPEAPETAMLNFEQPKEAGGAELEGRPTAAAAAAAAFDNRRAVIKFEATGELVDLIDRAKEVLAHLEAGRSLAALFGAALEALLDKRDPVRVAARTKARQGKRARKAKASGEPMVRDTDVASREAPPTAEGPTKKAPCAEALESAVQQQGPQQPASQPQASQTQEPMAAEPSTAAPPPVKPAATITRYIPAAIRAEVTAQSGGQCEYKSAEGRRCSARVFLEVDHVEPFSLGGKGELGNLRHLCSAHNRWRAAQTFGGGAH